MSGYTTDGLEHGIKRCRINIENLEQAIETERNTIKDYRFMLDEIQKSDDTMKAAREMEEKFNNGQLEVIRDSTD